MGSVPPTPQDDLLASGNARPTEWHITGVAVIFFDANCKYWIRNAGSGYCWDRPPSQHVIIHTGQLSLAVLSRLGALSSSVNCEANWRWKKNWGFVFNSRSLMFFSFFSGSEYLKKYARVRCVFYKRKVLVLFGSGSSSIELET